MSIGFSKQKSIIVYSAIPPLIALLVVVLFSINQGKFYSMEYDGTYKNIEEFEKCINEFLLNDDTFELTFISRPEIAKVLCKYEWANKAKIVSPKSILRGSLDHVRYHFTKYFLLFFVIYSTWNAMVLFFRATNAGWKRLSIATSLAFAFIISLLMYLGDLRFFRLHTTPSIAVLFPFIFIVGVNLTLGSRELYYWIADGFNDGNSDEEFSSSKASQSIAPDTDYLQEHTGNKTFLQKYYWILAIGVFVVAFSLNYLSPGDDAVVTLISTVVAVVGILILVGFIKFIKKIVNNMIDS